MLTGLSTDQPLFCQETKAKLDELNRRLNEQREEALILRKDCQAMIKTYQVRFPRPPPAPNLCGQAMFVSRSESLEKTAVSALS